MAKVKNPITFGEYYGIDPKTLEKLGVFNPTLAVDTRLFIDPLLLEKSSHKEISVGAVKTYRQHFTRIISLLSHSVTIDDVAWRSAKILFQFHEIRGTCLGYGAASISGSGFGRKLINHVMHTAKEIVELGIKDPDLFVAMALFENDIGPDRISDMTTNVIIEPLIKFNKRLVNELGVAVNRFRILGEQYYLALNPFHPRRTPIILIPRDILRQLPIAADWDGVESAASHNALLRNKVNENIAHIWATKVKRDKNELRNQALSSKEAFQTLLDLIHEIIKRPYDVKGDPLGLIKWAEIAKVFASNFPLQIKKPATLSLDSVSDIVVLIINQFRQLVENNGLWKSLWHNGTALPEKYSQRLFFATAYSYCKANNLDISPEVDSGTGQIDFKFSKGFHLRILVEVKLSTNTKLIPGYEKQIEAYKQAEETMRAFYLVIDVGKLGKKDVRLLNKRTELLNKGSLAPDIEFIDAKPRPSASHIK